MGQMIEPNRFYFQSEVRKLLGVSSKAICEAVREQRLRASKIGTNKLYKGEWLLAWLEACELAGGRPCKR